jgi:transcriptional regulator with XRE-family HTH domain
MNVGDNIKKLRKEKGLQQKQIAIELGIDQLQQNGEWQT